MEEGNYSVSAPSSGGGILSLANHSPLSFEPPREETYELTRDPSPRNYDPSASDPYSLKRSLSGGEDRFADRPDSNNLGSSPRIIDLKSLRQLPLYDNQSNRGDYSLAA